MVVKYSPPPGKGNFYHWGCFPGSQVCAVRQKSLGRQTAATSRSQLSNPTATVWKGWQRRCPQLGGGQIGGLDGFLKMVEAENLHDANPTRGASGYIRDV